MIESLKALEQYLQQNNMKSTLLTLRAQILSHISQKPSQQFLSLFQQQSNDKNIQKQNTEPNNNNRNKNIYQNPERTNHHLGQFSKRKNSKKIDLPVQGLLGKIAYSQKLIDDNLMTEKINHLMQNKIFIGQLTKMFPQTKQPQQNNIPNNPHKKQRYQQYKDQLDLIDGSVTHIQKDITNNNQNSMSLDSAAHQISAIDFNDQNQNSILSQPNQILEEFYQVDTQEEYTDDRDMGYHQHIFDNDSLMTGCQQLTKLYGYPQCAVLKQKKTTFNTNSKQDPYKKFRQSIQEIQKRKFPKGVIFPSQQNDFYPCEYNGINYDIMKMKIIYDRQKIGYQQTKHLQFKKGDIIAGRYQVEKVLGNGVFAKVIKAKDLSNDQFTCFKMIQNDKDFFDQALDELKLLRLIKANCDPNQCYLLNYKQMFYHRQHLFIQTDLLKDNLLTAFQTNPSFFSIPVIKKISRQILQALATLHSLNIIHADLKPENIMIKSYDPIEIRVIDLGNGSFTHDQNLSNYVQSRSYRAPEVVLGCGFNQKIDIWSVGCIIAELWTKNVLFYNYHIQGMLSRIQSIVGPWPQWMLQNGLNVANLFSNQNFIYFHDKEKELYHIFIPKKTTLKNRIRADDDLFIDFIRSLVQIDPIKRVSALEALQLPFIRN